jgi:hypothetical protein
MDEQDVARHFNYESLRALFTFRESACETADLLKSGEKKQSDYTLVADATTADVRGQSLHDTRRCACTDRARTVLRVLYRTVLGVCLHRMHC